MAQAKKKVLCIVGTRPEGIKMAPVIREFRSAGWAECIVVSTGQHREIPVSYTHLRAHET